MGMHRLETSGVLQDFLCSEVSSGGAASKSRIALGVAILWDLFLHGSPSSPPMHPNLGLMNIPRLGFQPFWNRIFYKKVTFVLPLLTEGSEHRRLNRIHMEK